jgi:F-type H+-transporting ATPase subunit delta
LKIHPLAKRYARALWELAEESGQVIAILQEIKAFEALFQRNQLFRWFLLTLGIGKEQKLKVIKKLLASNTPLFYHYLIVLIKKERQSYLPQLACEMERLYDLKQNRLRIQVTLPVELGQDGQNELEKRLKALYHSEIRLDTTVDESILGGMLVKIGDTLYDSSLRTQLNNLRRLLKSDKRVF